MYQCHVVPPYALHLQIVNPTASSRNVILLVRFFSLTEGREVYSRGGRPGANGTSLVCPGMDVYANISAPRWQHQGRVRSDPREGIDLGNCELTFLKNSQRLLASYRHHTGCGTVAPLSAHRISSSTCKNFSVQVSFSDDMGKTWAPLSTVIQSNVGMWEPFFFTLQHNRLMVAYSQELSNGGMQSIVWQQSNDEGVTWGKPITISDGKEHHSRDGMPGIARLADGSLMLVFEGFWATGKWGHFSVQARRSKDEGATWDSGAVIYSAGTHNAGYFLKMIRRLC